MGKKNRNREVARPSYTWQELDEKFPNQRRDLRCADCGSLLRLRDGKFGIHYACIGYTKSGDNCRGSHSCDKNTAEPMGVPGDAQTRKARIRAHEWLDRLWEEGSWSKTEAYQWLADRLSVPLEQCRIALFDVKKCDDVVVIVRQYLGDYTRNDRILDRDMVPEQPQKEVADSPSP